MDTGSSGKNNDAGKGIPSGQTSLLIEGLCQSVPSLLSHCHCLPLLFFHSIEIQFLSFFSRQERFAADIAGTKLISISCFVKLYVLNFRPFLFFPGPESDCMLCRLKREGKKSSLVRGVNVVITFFCSYLLNMTANTTLIQEKHAESAKLIPRRGTSCVSNSILIPK